MANRHQRRKYGSSRPGRGHPRSMRWQLVCLALIIMLAVTYLRVFMLR